ncbi:MAG: hypothetical protein AB7S75_22480 [Desulfococcaceae bacterium]
MKGSAVVFVVAFLFSGIGFWTLYGNNLSWDVYSDDTYWYSEEFSTRGKVIVTCVISGIVASIAVAFRVFIGHLKKKNKNEKKA